MKSKENKLWDILSVPVPPKKKQVCCFVGFIGYCSNYIPNFSAISTPLSDLTRKVKPNKVLWKTDP